MTLDDVGEVELIRRLEKILPRADARLRVGIGDDCAVWVEEGLQQEMMLTSDAVIEGVHFRCDEVPERIGHKALARVLSDLAAMGAEPGAVLVNVMAPGGLSVETLEGVYRGLGVCAARWSIAVAGGDVAASSLFALHVFATGYCPRTTALLRSGAGVGDALYVTGTLGGSLAGHHLDFQPRLKEGDWLRAGRWASAAMDISDGLATDLRHLISASKKGAVLYPESLPVSDTARELSGEAEPWQHALFDGEDYELLFTVPKEKQLDFERAWGTSFSLGCTCIGYLSDDVNRIALHFSDGKQDDLEPKAFEHFR